MTYPVQFRFADIEVERLDTLAKAEGLTRAGMLRLIVRNYLEPDDPHNVKRLNETSEYSQAAIAALVQKLIPEQQPIIIATTAERLRLFHGQK